jgi:hypothetical protein
MTDAREPTDPNTCLGLKGQAVQPTLPTSTGLTRLAAVALLLLSVTMPVLSQPTATVEEFLDGLLSISASKCLRRGDLARDFERQGKTAQADGARNGEAMICDCMPNRMRQLRARLSRQERSLKVTEADFSVRYLSEIVAPCTGESVRRPYADGCVQRFARAKPNTAKYCSCMSREVASLTDVETMELGRESADYLPIAAEAKKQGRAIPDQPPLLKRMTEMDAMCSRD